MTRQQIIEIIEDSFSQIPENDRKKHLHPEMIAYICDKYYRYYLSLAYGQSPDSLGECLYRDTGVAVKDDGSGNLYSVITKDVIPFFASKGGVFNIKKDGDSSLKFEGYMSRFERDYWADLNIPYTNNVRYWFESGNDSVESIDTNIVWYEFDNNELTVSDTVTIDILISFVAHDDNQEVYVPSSVGGVSQLIDTVVKERARKMGFDPQEIINREEE
jgi:hypothetical protein